MGMRHTPLVLTHHRVPITAKESVHALHLAPAGESPERAIVSVHGTGGPGYGPTGWRLRLARSAAEQGFHAFLFDSRGCGYSDGEFETWTVSKFVEDTCCVLDYAASLNAIEAGRIGLFGTSLGSAVSVLAARRRPEIARALVVFTLPCDMERNFLWYFERFQPGSLDQLYGESGRVWLSGLGQYLRREFLDDLAANDVRSAVAALQAPMLLLQPAEDNEVPRWVSSQAYALKPEPKGWVDVQGTHDMKLYDNRGEPIGWDTDEESEITVQALRWFREHL